LADVGALAEQPPSSRDSFGSNSSPVATPKKDDTEENAQDLLQQQDKVALLLPRLDLSLNESLKSVELVNQQLLDNNQAAPDAWLAAEVSVRELGKMFKRLQAFDNFLTNHEVFSKVWESSKVRYESVLKLINLLSSQYLKCSTGFTGMNMLGCYRFYSDTAVGVEAAIINCKNQNGFLLEIDSRREYENILKLTKGQNIWIGLKADGVGNWRWLTDGRRAKFAPWYSRPSLKQGRCAYLDNTGQTGWINYHCSGRYKTSFVCKQTGELINKIIKI